MARIDVMKVRDSAAAAAARKEAAMGKRMEGPSVRPSPSSASVPSLRYVHYSRSIDGANICHFPEETLFPFLLGIDYLSLGLCL